MLSSAQQQNMKQVETITSPVSTPKGTRYENSNSIVKSKLQEVKNPSKLEDKFPVPALPLGPKLPVLEALKKVIPTPENGGPSFAKVHFLSAQHLLETTLSVFDFAIERGLNPRQAVVIGKEYSTSKIVEDKLKIAGIHVIKSPRWNTLYGFDTSYGVGCRRACSKSAELVDATSFMPLVHDDGGGLAKILGDGSFEDSNLKNASIIEQTSSGGPIVEDSGAAHPRINLFSSCIKRIGEPPLIKIVTTNNIFKLVNEIRNKNKDKEFKNPENSTFGIIGAGNIGFAIAKGLVERGVPEIRIYDTDHRKMDAVIKLGKELTQSVESEDVVGDEKKCGESKLIKELTLDEKKCGEVKLGKELTQSAESENHASDERKAGELTTTIRTDDSAPLLVARSDVVIGCTGNNLVPEGTADKYFDVTKPTILLSASSRQIEFLTLLQYTQKLESKEAAKNSKSYEANTDINRTLMIKNGYRGNGRLAIPRMGTPVTFDNSPNAVSPELAQMIRGLIVSAMVQNIAISEDKRETEKAGKKFSNLGFKLSPLLQLFVAKTFLATMSEDERDEHYTNEEIDKMTHIESISNISEGALYKPFELTVRKWLDAWLKENNLVEEVDKWLNPAPAPVLEVRSTMRISM